MDDAAAATEPAFSPDGSRIAFVSTRDGQPEIYVMEADGTGATRLTNSRAADGAPSFTVDGHAVVFHSRRTAHRQIFVQPLTASDATQLTQEPADNSQPSVSPDGETIAFISNRDGSDDVWLMSMDGSNQRNFTKSAQVRERSPHFLRDGSLAFLTEARLGGRPAASQIVKADLVSGRLTPLAASDLPITDFAPAPAGDLVALVVAVQKNVFKVYLQPVGTGGGGPVPLPTTGAEQMMTPAFLP
jgi:Tol biopolymer transport system component